MSVENDGKAVPPQEMELGCGEMTMDVEPPPKEDSDDSIDLMIFDSITVDEEETDKVDDGAADATVKEEGEYLGGNSDIGEGGLVEKSPTKETGSAAERARKSPALVIVGQNHKFNVRSRYLSNSVGSCHDLCKYGHKHETEKKTRRLTMGTIREAHPITRTTSNILENSVAEKVKKKKDLNRRLSLPGPIPEKTPVMRLEDKNLPKGDLVNRPKVKRVQSEIKPPSIPSPGNSSKGQSVRKTVIQGSNLQEKPARKVKEIKTRKEEGSCIEGEKEVTSQEPTCSSSETSVPKEAECSKGGREIKGKEKMSNSPKTPLKKSPSVKARLFRSRKSSLSFKNQINPEEAKVVGHEDISEKTLAEEDSNHGGNLRSNPRATHSSRIQKSNDGNRKGRSQLSFSSQESSQREQQQGSEVMKKNGVSKKKQIDNKTEDGGSKFSISKAKAAVSRGMKNLDSKNIKQINPTREDGYAPCGISKVSQAVESVKIEVNGKEETLSNPSDVNLEDELGTTECSIDEGLTGDNIVKKGIVEGIHLEDFSHSTTVENSDRLTDLLDKSSSGELSASTSYMNSLPLVSEKECSIVNMSKSSLYSNEQNHIRDSSHGSSNKVKPSHFPKEEQFDFSDLDDSEVEKVEHTRTPSSGSEECLSQGSLESGEAADKTISSVLHQGTSKPTQDDPLSDHPSLEMNLNRVSSPISISKHHNNADEEALVPGAESLPNMLFNRDNLPKNVSQPLGHSLDSTLDVLKMVSNDVPVNSSLSAGGPQVDHSKLTTGGSQISQDIKKIISDPAVEVSLCRHLLCEGMGYEAAAHAFDSEKMDIDKFLSLGPEILGNDKLVVRIGGLYFPWDAAMPIASAIGSQGSVQILEPKGMIAVGQVDNYNSEGVTQKSINSQSGSWKIWPFSFKRTNSTQSRSSSTETASEGPKDMTGVNGEVVPKLAKKKLRTKMPTSEQLASLNLKEGKNIVTFTFSTAMLGEQKVDARIFLWKWNARIVISDVDGTITKSDVLGQFMPLMGMDWSQTGVAHLFSAIKENGYQLLFLSARSISQAYNTRQFLMNLKQDGKALPEGPVLISPDGLFPSLYREVIRRAPHEFKIACLEDVKVLFSPDHNPFYAGFGNRDTDELSYVKMGIPKGKIFTINPKGQVVVNRRVDSKSYTSLHALVHDMFPPTTLHEQEDYNSWNFWRLPPPDGIM